MCLIRNSEIAENLQEIGQYTELGRNNMIL